MSPLLLLAVVLELSFWPGKNAARDRRVLAIGPHPCGKVAIARVSALPRPGTREPIEPEEVIEWGQAGRIRKWPMPVDARPLAVQGDRLLVIYEAGRMLWISPTGAFAVHHPSAEIPDATDEPCPRQSQAGNSSYTVCRMLPDLRSGQRRMVQYESPCT